MELFDFLKDINEKHYRDYDYLKNNGYKNFQYIITRYISMSPEYIEFANISNIININDPQLHFDFFYYLLPKSKKFIKYIKSSKKDDNKHEELIILLSNQMKISKQEITNYFDLLTKEQILELKKEFGGKIK